MATKGFEHFTATDVARHALKHAPKPKRSKYGAVKTTVDGVTFDSKAEAARYQELKVLEKAGEIRDLVLQPRYSLHVRAGDAPVSSIIGEYRGDFRYTTSHGASVVEDVKGMKTPLYRWKKKHVEMQYGVTITEIR